MSFWPKPPSTSTSASWMPLRWNRIPLDLWTMDCRRLSIVMFVTTFLFVGTWPTVLGKLIFTSRLHEARIYHGAPAGLYVTTVRATLEALSNSTSVPQGKGRSLSPLLGIVTYKLLRGGNDFQVDETSGRVSTRRKITAEVGDSYALLVVAVSGGETESLREEVRVTRYNRFTPWFTLAPYHLEIAFNEPPGKSLLRVQAKDDDKDSYNAEVYYYLRTTGKTGGDIGPHSKSNDSRRSSYENDTYGNDQGTDKSSGDSNRNLNDYSRYFVIDPRTGDLSLRQSLEGSATNLVFDIVAIDGGSPHRWNETALEITVKSITEPSDISVDNIMTTEARVCWKRPQALQRGSVQGYLVQYREVPLNETNTPKDATALHREDTLNITTEEQAIRHCARLDNLRPNTKFELRVQGWSSDEVGISSKTVSFVTTKPHCPSEDLCGANGTCHVLPDVNDYRCDCDVGFFGEHCEQFDPCTLLPCHNLATCTNVSNSVYECKCVDGFYGSDCSSFNPCTSVEVVACHNGGICHSSGSHMFDCFCRSGFYGRSCERFNPCKGVPSPCLNEARCQNVSDTQFACTCLAGFRGKLCEENIDDCASSPCLNGGTCKDGIHSFSCVCSPGYEGALCQEELNECDSSPCLNGGSCEDRINGYGCFCPLGYRGHHCEEDIDECLSGPCLNGAVCRDGPMSFTCLCAPGYEGILCKDRMKCYSETLITTKGIFHFNSTSHGDTFKLECPYGPSGQLSTRHCAFNNESVEWMEPNVSSCRDEGFQMAESMTNRLRQMTADPSTLSSSQLLQVASNLEIVVEYAIKDQSIAKEMINVMSSVLDANETVFPRRGGNSSSSRLYHVLDRFMNEVEFFHETLDMESSNLKIAISKVKHSDATDAVKRAFQLKGLPLEENVIYPDTFNTSGRAVINVSPAVFDDVPKSSVMRLQFAAYGNAKLFRESSYLPSDRYTPANHPVFTLSIANKTVQNMSEAINFTVPKPLYGTWTCVYWDETMMGHWSTYGMTVEQTEDDITCSSSHMTAFSVLLDPDPQYMDAIHMKSLSIISYVGCGLSVIGLSLTIITYSMFRCLNRDKSGKILLNLCISMLLMNVAFLSGSLVPSSSQQNLLHTSSGFGSHVSPRTASKLCRMVALFTHYFLLTTLSWMTVEASNMYQLLIHVFATSETNFMLKRCLIAWGIPFVVVGGTAFLNIRYYDARNEYCMLSPDNAYVYYGTYVGPSCLLLLANIIVFILVTRVLFQPRGIPARIQDKPRGRSRVTITFAQVRGSFTVMTLLGVTWVFGALAVGPARIVFQYVFCVLNSLQGFLVFIFRCVQYPEARSSWHVFLKTGTLKKHRGVRVTNSTNSHLKLSLSGGSGGGFNGHMGGSTFRDHGNNSMRSTKTTSDGPSSFTAYGGAAMNPTDNASAPSWVYGGRLPRSIIGDMSTKIAVVDKPSTMKNRSFRHISPSRGSVSSTLESLDTKEGRDTNWQYLNLNGNCAGGREPKGCSVPKVEPAQLSACDTYDLPFVEDESKQLDDQGSPHNSIMVGMVSPSETDQRVRRPVGGSQCDQGYSSAEQSPSSKRGTTAAINGDEVLEGLATSSAALVVANNANVTAT